MKTSILKYGTGVLVLGILLYHSVFIRPLEEMKASFDTDVLDPKSYASDFWQHALPSVLEQAVDARLLLTLFREDMPRAIEEYANTLGIASLHAYLLKGDGHITEITNAGIVVSLDSNETGEILLKTRDLFGNAVRDASGMIDVSDFSSTMEFNNISSEINAIIRSAVVQPALVKATVGDTMFFIGATEVGEDEDVVLPLSIIPITITWK